MAEDRKHYGVAGGGCACGWQNTTDTNLARTQHIYDNNPEFQKLVDERGWPRDVRMPESSGE